MMGQPTDDDHAQQALATLKARLPVWEKILSQQQYLAGDELTIADLLTLAYGTWINRLVPDILDPFPNVKAWWQRISGRPSWQTIQADVAAYMAALQKP